MFHDNKKAWSGDHCIDPELIPGVIYCSHKIESEGPRLMDLGPTTLDLFGVDVPANMDGRAAGGRGRAMAPAGDRWPELRIPSERCAFFAVVAIVILNILALAFMWPRGERPVTPIARASTEKKVFVLGL